MMGKYDHPERIDISPLPQDKVGQSVALLRHIFNTTSDEDLRDIIHENGIRLKNVEGQFFAIYFVNHTIFNMNSYGLEVNRLLPIKQNNQQVHPSSSKVKGHNVPTQGGDSSDTNREWEVGRGSYEVNDERTLKR